MQPVSLTDGVLVLRPPEATDAPAVLLACQDPEIGRWTSVPTPYTQADAEHWVTREAPDGWANGTHLCWFVSTVEDPDTLLASIGLHHLDLETHDGEIGYWTVAAARGRGITTAAVRLACDWAFGALSLERIDWEAGVGNTSSRRVAEKVGFVVEGICRERLAMHGRRSDSWFGGLLPGDLDPATRPIVTTPVGADAAPAANASAAAAKRGALPAVVEITAGRLHLRPFRSTDAPAIATHLVDPATALWNPFDRAGTPEQDAQHYLDRVDHSGAGDAVQFAVADATTGALLGAVVLNHIDLQGGSAEVGYWTVPGARGRGVARRAVATVSRWAFAELNAERLELWHAIDNDASCKVATAAGFRYEITTRRSYRYGDGERHDEHLHARLATDPEPA